MRKTKSNSLEEGYPSKEAERRAVSTFESHRAKKRVRVETSDPQSCPENTCQLGFCYLSMEDNSSDEAALRTRLEETLASDPNNSSHRYNLGLFLWEKGGQEEKEKAAEHLVFSVKLNPSNGDAFRLLGHHYSRVSVDSQRASKCYQRAVTLNPEDFDAGEALCDLLDEGGKESLEVAICREASEKSPRAFWAWRRLGYLQVYQKKWPDAVQSLQHAIRGYPINADLWEALGLAYQRLGMFTAAVKSYGRAIELEGSRVFALVESGNILLMLGSCKNGVEQFRQALKLAPYNVAAHYGLASGLLGLSKDCVNSGAFDWGASLLEEASAIVMASSQLAGNVSSIWKLYGDIQIAYAKCCPWADEGQSLDIDEESFRTSVHSWKRKCLSAAISANRSYQRALHLTPWQPNIYTDIAISLDLACHLDEKNMSDQDAWQLPEKMSLGALMLEGNNSESWVILGCLSKLQALKQHALIRGLQLDVSLAVAWAYLGKLYREVGQKLLARQAFDHARSIDPSLALPWAGMAVDSHSGECARDEAYESCLRAVQISPITEFQIGLGKLSALSGHLLCPQVFIAVRQAVQRAPHYPEAHNLNGLVCEARSDLQSAITAYRRSRCAIGIFMKTPPNSYFTDVSVNLARSLCRAGLALDAARECEDLNKEGLLDGNVQQIYAVALWQLGENDRALSVVKNLVANFSTMNRTTAVASLGLACKLVYHIAGLDPARALALKMHRELLQSSKNAFVVSAISALDLTGRLQSLLPNNLHCIASYEEAPEFQSLQAIHKLIAHGSVQSLGIQSALVHLRKALHMHPHSSLLRNHLSSLLLSLRDWEASHTALRCVVIDLPGDTFVKGSKSPCEILGSAAVACYASCASQPKLSFPTCKNQYTSGTRAVHQLQKWCRQEPWNDKAQYLLVLNILQKARKERYPRNLCATIRRLLLTTLSSKIYEDNPTYQYRKFQLLLCASEVSLQTGDYCVCISHAAHASQLLMSNGMLFFAHLQLCRAYAAYEDLARLKDEYTKCLQLKTGYEFGWISLKFLESKYSLQSHSDISENFEACLKENWSPWSMWVSAFDLVRCQIFVWNQDFLLAEQALTRVCSTGNADACLFLTHGAICMELARQQSGSQFLSLAVRSLTRAQEVSSFHLPVVSALLAQAEASLGARIKWERNLRLEWFSWQPEMRPAELYFQMHLLARLLKVGERHASKPESFQSPRSWIVRAIHLNPSCLRYWKALDKIKE